MAIRPFFAKFASLGRMAIRPYFAFVPTRDATVGTWRVASVVVY